MNKKITDYMEEYIDIGDKAQIYNLKNSEFFMLRAIAIGVQYLVKIEENKLKSDTHTKEKEV